VVLDVDLGLFVFSVGHLMLCVVLEDICEVVWCDGVVLFFLAVLGAGW